MGKNAIWGVKRRQQTAQEQTCIMEHRSPVGSFLTPPSSLRGEWDSETDRASDSQTKRKETTTCNWADSRRWDVTTTWDLCEHFSEVAALLFGLAGRKLSGKESVKKRPLIQGLEIPCLWLHKHILFRLKGGIASISSRTQQSELHTPRWREGGNLMCYLWYLQKFSSLPRPHQMRQGIVTTKKEWRFKRQEFQACFGRTGGFEASTPLLKGECCGGGEKNQCWHKKACYLLLEIHMDVRL